MTVWISVLVSEVTICEKLCGIHQKRLTQLSTISKRGPLQGDTYVPSLK